MKKLNLKVLQKRKLGAIIDLLLTLDDERRAISKQADDIQQAMHEVRELIFVRFKTAEIEGAKGQKGMLTIKRPVVPSVKSWPKLYTYIKKNNAWDLLQKRVSPTAWRERIEAGKKVAGVESFKTISLSVSKRS